MVELWHNWHKRDPSRAFVITTSFDVLLFAILLSTAASSTPLYITCVNIFARSVLQSKEAGFSKFGTSLLSAFMMSKSQF